MPIKESLKTEQISCNRCQIQTKHIVHEVIRRRENIELVDDGFSEFYIYKEHIHSLLECLGCDTVTWRKNVYFSEYEDWNQPEEAEYYPPRVSRPLPNWVTDLPEDMQDLTTEIYTALWSDNRRLATMGIRSLFDMYCEDQLGGDYGNFGVKLKLLQERKIISDEEKNIFQNTIVDFGNSATHRRFKPKYKDLEILVQILEYLLHAHVVELRGNRLKDSVSLPTRNKSKN